MIAAKKSDLIFKASTVDNINRTIMRYLIAVSYPDDCCHDNNETLSGNHGYLALFRRRIERLSSDVTWTIQVDSGRRVRFTWLLPPSSRRRWTPHRDPAFRDHVTADVRLIGLKFLESGRVRAEHCFSLLRCSTVSSQRRISCGRHGRCHSQSM